MARTLVDAPTFVRRFDGDGLGLRPVAREAERRERRLRPRQILARDRVQDLGHVVSGHHGSARMAQ